MEHCLWNEGPQPNYKVVTMNVACAAVLPEEEQRTANPVVGWVTTGLAKSALLRLKLPAESRGFRQQGPIHTLSWAPQLAYFKIRIYHN